MTPAALLAVALACAALSPVIVARRWAFVGEGVGHSSLGGAGVVWLLAVAAPQVGWLRTPAATTLGVVAGSLAAALVIGRLARTGGGNRVGFDAAVGVVLVGSLALGFLARDLFARRFGVTPAAADALLFGTAGGLGRGEAAAALATAAAAVAGLWMYRREVLAYALDPEGCALHGVRANLVHHGLLLATAAVVAVGARLVGAVLVTALLVLPGATAATLARAGAGRTWTASLAAAAVPVALVAAVRAASGSAVPLGPPVVLALVAAFGLAAAFARLRRV